MISFETLFDEIRLNIANGMNTVEAINLAWNIHKIPNALYSDLRNKMFNEINSVLGKLSIENAGGLVNSYNKLMDDTSIKMQVAQSSARMRTDIEKELNKTLAEAKSMFYTARDIRDNAFIEGADTKGKVEIGLKELEKGPLKEEVKVITRRLNSGIKSDQLRYSYKKLIEASNNPENTAKLIKQREYTLKAKLKINAERIYKTETARAYNASVNENIANDKNAKFVKYKIEKRIHHKRDICDVYANADIGYGKGIYTLDKVPYLPAHPNCGCTLIPVYKVKGTQIKDTDNAISEAINGSEIKNPKLNFTSIIKKL